ncbi:NAD-dependent epimerase/dehydratase family protein [Rubellimicrobium roseum]|uniref:NAD-dependent epimerase/dehydratase family protein n=1 Tax=Rubellimicrobium roseum TaxID=687525 RepID=UPI00159B9F05|nr:NAD(P)-dependent oxidoreductase [Rubellimicrobium roseum]
MGRILVTGSHGLVGRELVAALEAQGHEVVPFDRRHDGSDLRDVESVARALQGCEGVFHLAAVSRVAWGEEDSALCHAINVDGTAVLLRAALDRSEAPWVVFASSREVYGNPPEVPVREDMPRAPVNAYGRSKRDGELLFEEAMAKGLRAALVRLSNVYGTEHDHPSRAVPSLLWRAMQDEDLLLTGSDVFFDFVHVEDCVKGLLRAAQALREGRSLPPLHLVTGVPTSLLELAQAAVRVTGSGSRIVVQPARSFDVEGFCGNPAQAEAVLGFRPRIGLEEGLGRLRDRLAARGRGPDAFSLSELT